MKHPLFFIILSIGNLMDWIFLGIIIGAISYLMIIILGFIEQHRDNKEKIEQTVIDIKRIEAQFSESEKARMEAENRTAKLETEALEYEQKISELHHKINQSMPTGDKTS